MRSTPPSEVGTSTARSRVALAAGRAASRARAMSEDVRLMANRPSEDVAAAVGGGAAEAAAAVAAGDVVAVHGGGVGEAHRQSAEGVPLRQVPLDQRPGRVDGDPGAA